MPKTSKIPSNRALGARQNQQQSVSKLLNVADHDGDGTLDEYELHCVLIANGILVPHDVVLFMFHAADVNSGGSLSFEEFGQFVLGPDTDVFRKNKDLWKLLRFDIVWWLNVMCIIAGVLFTVAAFYDTFSLPVSELKNLYLAGGTLYFSAGLYWFFKTPIAAYKSEQSYEKTTKKLLDALEKSASEHIPMSPEAFADDIPEDEDAIDTYIKEEIFGDQKTLTRTDLGLLLLKKIGTYDDAVLDRMLAMLDDDSSGTIDVDEFQLCIKQLNPTPSLTRRLTKVGLGLITNLDWLLLLTFISGSIVGISNNIMLSFGSEGIWVNENFTPDMFGAYAYFIGMLYFSSERVSFLRQRYEMGERVKGMMRSRLASTENGEEQETERWVESNKKSETFDRSQFNRLLEEQGIFIPQFQLDSLYDQIDTGNDNQISKEEIEVFVNVKTNKVVELFWACVKDFIFWASFLWTIGCILFIVGVYNANAAEVTYQIGSACLLIGGINTTGSCLEGKIDALEYVDNVRRAITKLLPDLDEPHIQSTLL